MDERRFAKLSLAFAFVARLILSSERRLSPDEAYYLSAAREHAWRWPISDHPPLLGWLLAPFDRLGGPIELRVRFVAAALQAVTALAIASTAGSLQPDKPEAFAWGAFLATWGLMSWASGLITTPDAPLLAATAGLLYFASRPRPAWPPLVLLSFVAVAAKVSGLVVVLAVAVSLRGAAGAAMLGGAALALPLARASLTAQLAHALGRGALVSAPRVGALSALLALVVGAVALYGPALVYLGVRGRAHLAKLPGGRALVLAFAVLVVGSALVSGRPPEPNWIAPALVPLLVVAAVAATELTARARRSVELVHLLPAMVAIGLWGARDLLPAHLDPLARVPRVASEGGRKRAEAHPLPRYARPAWACVYDDDCRELRTIFYTSDLK